MKLELSGAAFQVKPFVRSEAAAEACARGANDGLGVTATMRFERINII